jgi:hypothetical protein
LDLLQGLEFSGEYPLIKNNEYADATFIPFNKTLTCKNCDKNVHFFIHDYQFERCWRLPDLYVDLLKKFKTVLSPDFSIYVDMPKPTQMFNHYRKQVLGAYWQSKGVNIIPTICWGLEDTFDFCFEGYEKGGIVAVSTLGSKTTPEIFYNGYYEMLERLEPEKIIVYGGVKNMSLGGNIIDVPLEYFGKERK